MDKSRISANSSSRLMLLTSLLCLSFLLALDSSIPAVASDTPSFRTDWSEVVSCAMQFPVVFDSSIDSMYVQHGDPVDAHLKEALRLNGQTVAPANSPVLGHVEVTEGDDSEKKSPGEKNSSRQRSIKLVLDEIVIPSSGKRLKVMGSLAQQNEVFNNEGTFKKAKVSATGEIVLVQIILERDDGDRDNDLKPDQKGAPGRSPASMGMGMGPPAGKGMGMGMKPPAGMGMKPPAGMGMKPPAGMGMKPPAGMMGTKPPAGMPGMGAMGPMSQPLGMIASSALPIVTSYLSKKLVKAINNRKATVFIQPGDELLAQASLVTRTMSASVQGQILNLKKAPVGTCSEQVDFASTENRLQPNDSVDNHQSGTLLNGNGTPELFCHQNEIGTAGFPDLKSLPPEGPPGQSSTSPPEPSLTSPPGPFSTSPPGPSPASPPGHFVMKPLMLLSMMPMALRQVNSLPGVHLRGLPGLKIMNSVPGLGPMSQPVLMMATSTVPVIMGALAVHGIKPGYEKKTPLFNQPGARSPFQHSSAGGRGMLMPGSSRSKDAGDIPDSHRFPVLVNKKIETAYTHKGDAFEGMLPGAVRFSDRLTLPAGSTVLGHVSQIQRSRRLGRALLCKQDRLQRNASLTVELDEIVTPANLHVQIAGSICQQFHVFNNSGNFKAVAVGYGGRIAGVEDLMKAEPSQTARLVAMAARMAVQQVGGNAITFGAMPVVMGVVGAVAPCVVSGKPPEEDDTSRTKGFVLGATGQIPGGIILRDFIYKGEEICLEEGDELLAEAQLISKETSAERIIPSGGGRVDAVPTPQESSQNSRSTGQLVEEHAEMAIPLVPKKPPIELGEVLNR